MKAIIFILSLGLLAMTTPHDGLKVGDKAPEFNLKNTDGKMVSLSDYKDKEGVVVIFTCNHCPFSIKYEDRINDFNKKYAAQGYPVVAINPNDATQYPEDSYENMVKRARQKKFSFAYLHDESQQIAHIYGAARTPHVFLLKKQEDNSFKVAYIGAIDDDHDNIKGDAKTKYLEDAVASLQSGKSPSPDYTKAVGCTIKWKAGAGH